MLEKLEELRQAMQTYRDAGLNPVTALANHKDKVNLFRELVKDRTVKELFGRKDETKFSTIEKLFNFLYSVFGAKYEKRDVNALDQNGQSPLHHLFGSKEIVQILVEQFGANPNIKNTLGETPLMKAAEYGYGNTAVYLLDKGADPKAIDDNGKNLLHKLAEQFKARDLAGQLQVVQALNEKGILSELLEQKDKEGKTPLDYAKNSEKGVSQILVDALNKPEKLKDPELQKTIEILGALKTLENPPSGILDKLNSLKNLDELKEFGKSDLVREVQSQIEQKPESFADKVRKEQNHESTRSR